MKRKILSIFIAAVMLVGIMPLSAFAGELPGNEPEDCVPVSFVRQDGTVETTDDYTLIGENSCLWQDGTYVVTGDITLNGSASVVGTVDLVLCDGASLSVSGDECQAGIYVPVGNTLNIYAQKRASGKLYAAGGDFAAGIGGSFNEDDPSFCPDCGAVNIFGGIINAVGGFGGAGIGGGWEGSAGTVTIFGGTVTASGDDYFGAGIGAGEDGNNAGTVVFEGGNTHVSGARSVRCEASVSSDLLVYDFDIDQYSIDGWRLGNESNPSVDSLIGSCSFIENGEKKIFPTHFRFYDGRKNFNTGFYYVMQDYTFDDVLTVTGESQLVLADGVTVDARIGKNTGNDLNVFIQSTGEEQGRALGLAGYNEKGKFTTFPDFVRYGGEDSVSAGVYYVDESYELEDPLTVNGKVILILDDGVTIDARNGKQVGNDLKVYTQSLWDEKGCMLGYKGYDEQGQPAFLPDFTLYGGEASLSVGAYYVTDNFELEGSLTVNGAVGLILKDGVTLKVDKVILEQGSSFAVYTESLSDNKGRIDGYIMSSPKYIDEYGMLADLPQDYSFYNGETTLTSGWYFVSDKGCDSRVTVDGTVFLVLGDGADVCFNGGFDVSNGDIICIYAQSTGERMGAAEFNAPSGKAGIGSSAYSNCGRVDIYGGKISANGGEKGAGIGGGDCGDGGNVSINGGIVNAVGGSGAAGIGGGPGKVELISSPDTEEASGAPLNRVATCTHGGLLTVTGGTLTVTAGSKAAAIGGGSMGHGSSVVINGGTICAYGNNTGVIGTGKIEPIYMNDPDDGTFYLDTGLAAYSSKMTDLWCIGPSTNLVFFKSRTDLFVFDSHYYDAQGVQQVMQAGTIAYTGETALKKNSTYYVRESCTVDDPIFVPEGVTLILADGVVMNATKGMIVMGDSEPVILTQSLGANKGVFTGEMRYCYNSEGEAEKFPSNLSMYNGETILTQGYLVTEDVTVEEPILLNGSVSLFLYDGVTFNAAKGYLMTPGSTLTVYTLSRNENMGVFIGEKLTKACEKNLPEYVELYNGQTSPSAGWYYVSRDCSPNGVMIIRENVHLIIPDGVTFDAAKDIYMTESASLDICPLSDGENAGRVTGQIFDEYIDGNGSHPIPDSAAVYAKGTTTLNSSCYLVLENNTVDVFSIPAEDVTLLIADGVTLEAKAGYFGYEPNIGTFSSGANAGRYIGGALSYLDENGSSCLLPSDAHLYKGESVLTEGIWFVGSSKTESKRIAVSGDVLLVLGDSTTLKLNRGITVEDGNSLTVTSQSEGDSRGKLIAYTFFGGDHDDVDDVDYGAAIGSADTSDNSFGRVVIWNGYVEAHGFSGGAGIGNEYSDRGGTVTISGGTVVSYGNEDGIGIGGDGTTVTVLGGDVFACGDETDEYGGSGFGGKDSVLNVFGGRVRARGKYGDLAISGAAVTLGEEMRALEIDTNMIYEETIFSSDAQGRAREVLFFDASAVDEDGETVSFPATGRLYAGETVLEEDVWYYVAGSDEAEDVLIFREGACMVLADGVTLNAENGILCPASGAPAVYSTSNGENKGKLSGMLMLPYLDSENEAHALPDDASLYNGQTELDNEWVFVGEDHILTAPLIVRGNVNIVLADGVTLDAAEGVVIEENGQLNVLYVSDGEDKGVFIGIGKGYIDEDGIQRDLPENFAVYNGETTLSDGWYFVTEDTVLENPVEISGDVTLVLADGVTLTANKGILLSDGNSLTVYAQSEGENAGSVAAYGSKGAAGIGGDFTVSDAGTLTVNGGHITAAGGVGAAGIGGGLGGSGSTVVINNGTLTVTGGAGVKAIGGGTGAASDGDLTINESLAVETGSKAQNITAFEYDSQSFVKVTNHGEKYLCGIVTVSDGTAENVTVTLTDTENSANVYNGKTDGTNVYYVDNAANGRYIMSVACDGAVTRTYTVEITDGRVVKSAELYIEGDVSGDGVIDIYDYQQAVNTALSNENAVPEEGDLSETADYEIAVADSDCDGYVDVIDVALIERKTRA